MYIRVYKGLFEFFTLRIAMSVDDDVVLSLLTLCVSLSPFNAQMYVAKKSITSTTLSEVECGVGEKKR